MKICDVLTHICSFVAPAAAFVHSAYTSAVADIEGIGGKLAPGPVRLAVTIGYDVIHEYQHVLKQAALIK